MNRLATVFVALVAFAAATELAAARDGCGGGFYWNGYACARMGPAPAYYGRGRPSCYNYYGRRICCPLGFTVQDGVCKPYRGY